MAWNNSFKNQQSAFGKVQLNSWGPQLFFFGITPDTFEGVEFCQTISLALTLSTRKYFFTMLMHIFALLFLSKVWPLSEIPVYIDLTEWSEVTHIFVSIDCSIVSSSSKSVLFLITDQILHHCLQSQSQCHTHPYFLLKFLGHHMKHDILFEGTILDIGKWALVQYIL